FAVRDAGALEGQRRLCAVLRRQQSQVVQKRLVGIRLKRLRNVGVVLRQPALVTHADAILFGERLTAERKVRPYVKEELTMQGRPFRSALESNISSSAFCVCSRFSA